MMLPDSIPGFAVGGNTPGGGKFLVMLPPLFQAAKDYIVDPLDLMFALASIQERERDTFGLVIEARAAARKATGLTFDRLQAWEDKGRDQTSWKCRSGIGLDIVARELANMYPALGIVDGIDVDHAARLWDVLRTADPVIRDCVSLLNDAAEMVLMADGR